MWKPVALCLWCLSVPAMAALNPPIGAAPPAAVGLPLARDLFIASGSVSVTQPVLGDLVATGGNIDVEAPVAGDVIALGGKLRLGAPVGRSLVAAAGQLSVHTTVAHNLRVTGGQIELGPTSDIGGNVSVASGELRLLGRVRGEVRSTGGRLLIDGPVDGDVHAYNGRLELGPNARLAGTLSYRSQEPLVQDPAAQVNGGIEQVPLPVTKGERAAAEPAHPRAAAAAAGAVWTIGLILLAALLQAALPARSARVARSLRERPGTSLLLGFAWLVCLPVAAVLLFITLVGIPLGLLALAVYAALMPIAYVAAGIGVGDWALQRWLPQRAEQLAARIVACSVVLVALSLLSWVPVLGGAAGFLALLAGLGALILQVWRLPAAATAAT